MTARNNVTSRTSPRATGTSKRFTLQPEARFAIVFVVVNLHTMRRVAEIPYLLIYSAISLLVLNDALRKRRCGKPAIAVTPITIWLSVALLGLLTSLVTISVTGAFTGLSRFLFALPVFFAFVAYTRDSSQLQRHISFMVSFFTLASLSIPLQIVTGPIPWFAEASQRAGLERFGTLLGSMIIVAGLLPAYMILSQVKSARTRWLWVTTMTVAAMMSLSKAALAGAAIGLVGLLILNRQTMTKFAVASIAAGCMALAAVVSLPPVYDRVRVALDGYGLTLGSDIGNSDISVTQSALDRLSVHPLENFRDLADLGTPLVYLTGGGYGMGGRALVPGEDPIAHQAHNQYGELLTVFGPIGASLAIGVLLLACAALWNRFKSMKDDVFLVCLLAMLVQMLGAVFANGRFYHPASASVLYLGLFVASSARLGPLKVGLTPLDRIQSTRHKNTEGEPV